MSRVKGKNTSPELQVRELVRHLGIRCTLHRSDLAGSPDIVIPRYNMVIFVHGCFWHRHKNCKKATFPKTRSEFWAAKFERNVARDKSVRRTLRTNGWRVLTIWECQIRRSERVVTKIEKFLRD